ncbi:MAG: hypothetical protein ACJ8F7_18505, partial [Gemmataceae bacterium]
GAKGNVAIGWYQYDRVTEPDCGKGNIYIYESSIFDATSAHPRIETVNASRRPISKGGICQGGTGCVASGKDRRLGDYFSVATDHHGCVIIASGDTMLKDPISGGELPTSRPIFIGQSAGTSLTGEDCSQVR